MIGQWTIELSLNSGVLLFFILYLLKCFQSTSILFSDLFGSGRKMMSSSSSSVLIFFPFIVVELLVWAVSKWAWALASEANSARHIEHRYTGRILGTTEAEEVLAILVWGTCFEVEGSYRMMCVSCFIKERKRIFLILYKFVRSQRGQTTRSCWRGNL